MAPHFQFDSILCKYCTSKIFPSDFKLKQRFEKGIQHYYLLEWTKESDLACRSLIYFLKNKSPCFFSKLASLFKDIPDCGPLRTAVVPGCSEEHKLNHAQSFALSLMKQSLVSGVYKAGLTERAEMGQQKRKSRQERLRSSRMDVSGFRYVKNWIFVDDVLVSGGTFQSLTKSMFTKPHAVFTLLYKPRLNNKGFYDA